MKTLKTFRFALALGLWSAARAADSSAPARVSAETIQRIESFAPTKATAVPAKPRKVMIFCSVTGWRPPAISLVNKTFEILGRKTGAFEVATVSEDASIFAPAKLAEFDAIVMNNCNELKLDEERSRALQDFVRNGKGVVGLGSTISIINWPEEAEMMGGFCFRHPFTGVPSNPKSTWPCKIRTGSCGPRRQKDWAHWARPQARRRRRSGGNSGIATPKCAAAPPSLYAG